MIARDVITNGSSRGFEASPDLAQHCAVKGSFGFCENTLKYGGIETLSTYTKSTFLYSAFT